MPLADPSDSLRGLSESALESLVPLATRELEHEQANGSAINRVAQGLLPILRRYIAARGWGLEDPEMTANDVLATVLARLPHYEPAAGSLAGWAIGIARRIIWREIRQQQIHRHPTETEHEQKHREKFHLKTRLPVSQRSDLVDSILELPEIDHRLLQLVLVDKKDATEVAAILRLTPGAVRKRKERLLKKLHAAAESSTLRNSERAPSK